MIPHNKPTMGNDEASAAAKVIASNYLVSGNNIARFEDEMCEYLGLPNGHAVCVTSGSSALFIALHILELANKNIVLPSYVCSSLKHACLLNNAKPIYIDNNINSTLPNINSLENKNFDALIYPYLYGFASKLPKLENKLIIEDLAQALGARIGNKMLGTIGDIGVLSFYATKMISAGGQGGMLVSKHKTLIDKAKSYLDFDQKVDEHRRFNFHITEMQAAIGRVQLQRLPQFIEQRRILWDIYQEQHLTLLDIKEKNFNHVRYRAIIHTDKQQTLIRYLNTHNISAINPFTRQELLSKNCPNAVSLCKKTVSLPLYPSLAVKDAQKIAQLSAEVLFNKC
jgi:perosamine synthetase